MLLTILPFKNSIFKEEFNKKWYFLLIFTAILGANMEQASLIMFVFAFITNIYIVVRDKKIRIDLVIFNIFIAINTAVLFLAPGNYERSNKEIVNWFGQWDMISLPTKLMMGLNLFLEHIFESNIIMISILVIFKVFVPRIVPIVIKTSPHIIFFKFLILHLSFFLIYC